MMSLDGLSGADDGLALARRLGSRRGVLDARFHVPRAEISVTAPASIDALAEARLLQDGDYRVLPGPGRGSYLAWTKPPTGTDVLTLVAGGEDVADLAALAVPGKITLFDFAAKWCPPCRDLDGHVLGILVARKDVAYRKLEMVDWDSPLAKHYLRGGVLLPYVVVFDASGKLSGVVSGLDLAKLDRLLGDGPAR